MIVPGRPTPAPEPPHQLIRYAAQHPSNEAAPAMSRVIAMTSPCCANSMSLSAGEPSRTDVETE